MPYKVKGKCVYKKDTGKKVGCTKGSVNKYLAALHINAKEATGSFKEYFAKVNAADGSQKDTDYTVTSEGEYASSSGDNTTQGSTSVDNIGFSNNGPTFTVEETKKNNIVNKAISFLEKLQKNGVPTEPGKQDILLAKVKQVADELFSVGIEPIDFQAALKNPQQMWQYLITGPSAPGGGGKGALEDLKSIRDDRLINDDESNPGGKTDSADIEQIDLNTTPAQNDPNSFNDRPESALEAAQINELKCWKGYTRVKGKRPGSPGSCRKVQEKSKLDIAIENFMDKKGPGRPGDSKRHGIKKKSTLASLDKIVHSKTASPRKKQLAHWQANMRRGKAKKR